MLTLNDGRQLGYGEYGALDGTPLLLFHGAPGSHSEFHPDHSILESLNVRLIVPDRPGYGRSDPDKNRTLLSWADDVLQLMDHLVINSCPVLGFSGGGPYAMACASEMPDRVSRLGLISSLAPFDNPYGMDGMNEQSKALFALALSNPDLFAAQIAELVTDADVLYQIMTSGLPKEDQAVFACDAMSAMYRADMNESLRTGVGGIVSDMLLYPQEWGFNPSAIGCSTLLWQGLSDINVPPSMGEYLSEIIPGCRSSFIPEKGHFLLFTHWEEIFSQLID